MPTIAPRLRRLILYFLAVSLALPIGFVSLAKLLLFLGALLVLLGSTVRSPSSQTIRQLATPWAVLAAMSGMALSMAWGEALPADALAAFAKHGKALTIALLVVMVRNKQEAGTALLLWVAGQFILVCSSLLLAAGVPLPWQTSREPQYHAVFSSYLDQSIMAAVLAAVAWHLRGELPQRYALISTTVTCGLALITVFFVFPGRTAHLIGVVLLCMALAWGLPTLARSGRWLLFPLVLVVIGMASMSGKVRDRAELALVEVQQFSAVGNTSTSSGIRLNLWRRSAQAIAEDPLIGHGVGSWNQVYERTENRLATGTPMRWSGNPHQEFLLWGVELGVLGIALLALMLSAIYRDSLQLPESSRRALLSVMAALLVASMFNSVLFDALIGDFFCTVIGLLMAYGLSTRAETSVSAP